MLISLHRLARSVIVPVALALGLMGGPGAASAEPATVGDDVVVTLDTGESFYGVLARSDDESITLRIAGVDTLLSRDRLESIVTRRTPAERYRSMRAIIDDDDIPRLLLLVDWLMQRDLLDDARAELDAVLDQDRTNPDAARVSRLLNQRIALRDRSRNAQPLESRPEDRPDRERVSPPGRFGPGQFPLLTDEQINLIKVYELDLQRDSRVLIDRDTTEKFLSAYSGAAGLPRTETERRAFLRRPPTEILDLMFKLRARELYPEVRVLELPESLRLFRDYVAGSWLTRNCGSVSCHGGTDAPAPHIYNRRPFSETTVLTNFVILEKHRLPGGLPLIDYQRPGDSPLLQLALPRADSAHPHPDVPGWRPALRSRNVNRYQQAVEWIETMIRPRPETPIQYTPVDIAAVRAQNAARDQDVPGEDDPEDADPAEAAPPADPRDPPQRREQPR